MQRKVKPSRTGFIGIAFTFKVLFPYLVIAAKPEKRLRGEIREKHHLREETELLQWTHRQCAHSDRSHGGPVKGKTQQHNTLERPLTFT